METVLLVGDAAALEGPLSSAGYTCHAASLVEAVHEAVHIHADVIVAPADAVGTMRGDFQTRFVPLILVADGLDEELLPQADDYVFADVAAHEITTRVRVALLKPHAGRSLDPLTGLSGKTVLMEEIASRLKARQHFAALYADLHNFDAFNRHYGFARGDEAIRALARVVCAVLEEHPSQEHFAGHIGGDDFLVLTDRFIAQDVARDMVARFDAIAPDLHDPEDRERGFIEFKDRKGDVHDVPMLSVSIGITVSGPREFHTYAELEHVAEEMNAVAKKEQGSAWAIDRRRGPVA